MHDALSHSKRLFDPSEWWLAVIAMADLWHREFGRCQRLMPKALPTDGEAGWPALFQPWLAGNGVGLSCLLTPRELAEEGSPGLAWTGTVCAASAIASAAITTGA